MVSRRKFLFSSFLRPPNRAHKLTVQDVSVFDSADSIQQVGPPLYRTSKKKLVRQVGASTVVAVGALATGGGVANAATHTARKKHDSSISTRSDRSDRTLSREFKLGDCRGGDVTAVTATSITILDRSGISKRYPVNSSTPVNKNRVAPTAASLVVVENVRLTLGTADATLATTVEIVPANIAGKVTAVVGDTITIAGTDAISGTIVVGATTTYSKAGSTATQGDVTVGTFAFAEGTFGLTPTTVDGTTVGIGQPGTARRSERRGATGPPRRTWRTPVLCSTWDLGPGTWRRDRQHVLIRRVVEISGPGRLLPAIRDLMQ